MGDEALQQKLGGAIRASRAQLGLSQEQFADQIGMHRAYYSKVERGEQNLTLATLGRVLDGLGARFSQLFKEAGL